ncbi:hypothetical protein, partial [Kyrpidia sp.]
PRLDPHRRPSGEIRVLSGGHLGVHRRRGPVLHLRAQRMLIHPLEARQCPPRLPRHPPVRLLLDPEA